MVRLIAVAAVAALVSAASALPSAGQALVICSQINQDDANDGLRQYSDDQIRNGLCVTTRELANAMASGQQVVERACKIAAVAMFKEFQRRFPDQPAKEVTDRC